MVNMNAVGFISVTDFVKSRISYTEMVGEFYQIQLINHNRNGHEAMKWDINYPAD
jgi:hypothetical protein